MATWRNSLFFCSFLIFLCWAEATKGVNKKELKDSPGCRDAVSRSRVVCGEPIGKDCLEDSCYTYNERKYTWEESRKQCKKNGGDLVSIETEEEMTFLKNRTREREISDVHFYVGLFVEESPFEWESGKPLTYDRWHKVHIGIPDWRSHMQNVEGAVLSMSKEGGYYGYFKLLKQANLMHWLICEKKRTSPAGHENYYCFTTTCYQLVKLKRTWRDAIKECKGRGGDLVSMETECEWRDVTGLVRTYMVGNKDYDVTLLIGLKKKPVTSWKWVSNASYTLGEGAWTGKGPIGRTSYAFMVQDINDTKRVFSDADFSCEKKSFMCEKKIDYKPPEK